MQGTPNANRKHIVLLGRRNAGKSSLMNAIVGQDVSIVSDIKGTTTDPITKPMEFLPFGPVVFVDTAGLDDEGSLGSLRVERTMKVLERTDFALYVMDAGEAAGKNGQEEFDALKTLEASLKRFRIPYLLVFNKIDLVEGNALLELRSKYPEAAFVTTRERSDIHQFKDLLLRHLSRDESEDTILGDLVPSGGTVVMVVPIDSEAPKGRIILPQVQLIRDCLDHGIKSYVVRDTELQEALGDLRRVDLVVTDSQAFQRVSQLVPESIPLTSFSILFARYKGDIGAFARGAEAVAALEDGSRVLISESCTHNHSHEDIGRVKIPKLLRRHTGKDLLFEFKTGHDLPRDLSAYDLVIHCGSCMLNRKTMESRIALCEEVETPITNYGVVLALVTGILERSLAVFSQDAMHQKTEPIV